MRKLALSDEILLKIEKPARYIGGEVNAVMKDEEKVDIRFAMCFPDVYEIGMSHLGIQILYDMFNRREDVWCERVYSPWHDLDQVMRDENIPLFALESQDPVRKFDFLGITIQFEMCYTNILQILDLSHIPLHAADRTEEDPIVIGGGPCAYNPEPLAEFFDIFYIGEGETVYDQLLDLYKEWKKSGQSRIRFLEQAAEIDGCGKIRLFTQIMLPLIKPALATSAIFSFYWKWDDFMGSLLYLNTPENYTVSIALKLFSDPTSVSDYGAMFAMCVLSLLPVIILFLLTQRYIVEGISMSGLKS